MEQIDTNKSCAILSGKSLIVTRGGYSLIRYFEGSHVIEAAYENSCLAQEKVGIQILKFSVVCI